MECLKREGIWCDNVYCHSTSCTHFVRNMYDVRSSWSNLFSKILFYSHFFPELHFNIWFSSHNFYCGLRDRFICIIAIVWKQITISIVNRTLHISHNWSLSDINIHIAVPNAAKFTGFVVYVWIYAKQKKIEQIVGKWTVT